MRTIIFIFNLFNLMIINTDDRTRLGQRTRDRSRCRWMPMACGTPAIMERSMPRSAAVNDCVVVLVVAFAWLWAVQATTIDRCAVSD
jgi:hypothetical protein